MGLKSLKVYTNVKLEGFPGVCDRSIKYQEHNLGRVRWIFVQMFEQMNRVPRTAEQWADALLDRLAVGDRGLPSVIISDRDPKFISAVWRAMMDKRGIKQLYSTSYHAQTDGQNERPNQIIEVYLQYAIASLDKLEDWPDTLSTSRTHTTVPPRSQRVIRLTN